MFDLKAAAASRRTAPPPQGRELMLLEGQRGFFGQKNLLVLVAAVKMCIRDSDEFHISTDAEFLRGALEEQKLIQGEESQYGLFVTTVNGVTADESQQQWWCFTKGGEALMTGVDSTPIANGDAFEITLTTGY